MNEHCLTCDIEKDCGYEYKPTECCCYRKFTEITVKKQIVSDKPFDRYTALLGAVS